MRNMKLQKRGRSILFVLSLLLLSSCAAMNSSSDSAPPMENLPALSSFVGEYRDIELPADMKYNHKKSMVVRTDSFTGGVFYFNGKVQRDSLKSFIVSSMQKNKWKLAGEVTSENSMLAFTKPNKSCTVIIEEGFGGSFGSTYAAVYVSENPAAGFSGN